jgi:hypothetical protein
MTSTTTAVDNRAPGGSQGCRPPHLAADSEPTIADSSVMRTGSIGVGGSPNGRNREKATPIGGVTGIGDSGEEAQNKAAARVETKPRSLGSSCTLLDR